MPDEIKKEPSQEELKFARLAKRFIRQATITMKNFRMFGENHPVLANSIRNIHELLKTALAGKESITFTFLEGTFLVEDIPLKDMDLTVYSFIPELKKCGVTSLTFLSGVNEEELRILLKALSSGPLFIKEEGGVINIINKKNIVNIKADEMYFKRVSKKEEETEEAKTKLADMLVVDYLLGKTSLPTDKLKDLSKEISVNPERLGIILSDVSKKAPEAGHSAAGFTCARIDKLARGIKGAGDESSDKIKKNIGNLILALEPSLRGEVLRSDEEVCTDSAFIKDTIREFSDEVVIKIIVSDFVDNKASVVETRKLIRRLVPEIARRAKVFPVLEKRLIQKGTSQKVCSELLEGKFWEDMADEEKVKSIEEREPLYCVEIGIAAEIEKLVSNLLKEKKFNLVRIVIDKMLGNLASNNADLKIRFVRDFEHIVTPPFRSKEYPYKEEIVKRLREESKRSKEEDIKKRFANLAVSLIKVCFENKSYNYIPPLISISGYESIKDNIFKETDLETFLKELLCEAEKNQETIKNLLTLMGKEAEHILCNILLSIAEDAFDAYKKRHAITMFLKDLGGEVEDFLIGKLSSDKRETVKIALEALSEIGAEKSIPHIKELANHKDAAVQKRSTVALKNIEKRVKRQ